MAKGHFLPNVAVYFSKLPKGPKWANPSGPKWANGLSFLEEIRDDKVHHRLEMLSTKDDDGVCHLLAVIMGISKFPFSKGPSQLPDENVVVSLVKNQHFFFHSLHIFC